MKAWIKKLLHRHKYTQLRMYPPRPQYGSHEWGFLLDCECGQSDLTKLPGTIKEVTEMVNKPLDHY